MAFKRFNKKYIPSLSNRLYGGMAREKHITLCAQTAIDHLKKVILEKDKRIEILEEDVSKNLLSPAMERYQALLNTYGNASMRELDKDIINNILERLTKLEKKNQ